MAVIRWLLILMVLFVLIIFGVENMGPVTLSYYYGNLHIPLFFLVLLAVMAGALLAGLLGLVDQVRLRARLRQKGKIVDKLEAEVKSLRNLPLDEESGDDFEESPVYRR